MKRAILIASLFIPVNSYALYCPGSVELLSRDMPVAEVIKVCGEPAKTSTYKRTISKASTWTYVKQENGSIIKATLQFKMGRLQDISLERTPNDAECRASNSCETESLTAPSYSGCTQIVVPGNTAAYVINSCGDPDSRVIHEADTSEYTELTYPQGELNVLFFKNGKLISMGHNSE